jgi:predicted AAA+ superfamily ATPase
MIERKAYRDLLEWKKRNGQSALLIEGARRVGKSTLAGAFGKGEYRTSLIIDFSVASDDVKALFDTMRDDLDSFFRYLQAYYGVTFYPRDTLIVFDEVQLFPRARSFVKQLVADGRYDYIETGSLISIKKNIGDILIPSEEEPLALNPLDFEEFLAALGEDPLIETLRGAAEQPQPLPDAVHRKALKLFREYVLVGGMPQAVEAYRQTGDFGEVDRIKRRILGLYRNDVARYAKGYEDKVLSIFDDIPAQLSRHEKKFRMAALGKNARIREHEEALFWLQDAKVVNICYNNTDPNVGLGLNRDRPTFKCYLADTGLLVTQAFADRGRTPHEVYREILAGKLELNEGMLMENVVAQSLKTAGYALYFYSRSSREDSSERMEVDFLIVRPAPKSRICPIEVKSGKKYALSSLDKFKSKFGARVGEQFVLHTGNIKTDAGRTFLPLYLAAYL